MIISASRRTDIPAFYSDWFMQRIRQGFFVNVNPFNANQSVGYSLAPQDVDVIVFWTKNPKPLLEHLDELDALGYRYYFQFTLNDYSPLLEPRMAPITERIEVFRRLSEKVGPGRVIWRYDPIIISSVTPAEYHLERLEQVASQLAGYSERLVVSFVDYYGKVSGRLSKLAKQAGVMFEDITLTEHRHQLLSLAGQIHTVAQRYGLPVFTCAEILDLGGAGIAPGSCIDGRLIATLFGLDKGWAKDKNQRDECLCASSVDMGAYNTCGFQCSYCYANFSEGMMKANRAKHFSDSPTLVGRPRDGYAIRRESQVGEKGIEQLSLFRQDH